MADINLLQTQKESVSSREVSGVFNAIGVIILILTLGVYGFLFFLQKHTTNQVAALEQQRIQTQNDITKVNQYSDFLTAQEKLNGVEALLDTHLAWSHVISDFTQDTLQNTTYSKFIANNDGTATIQGSVPDFRSLDKLIQGFNLDTKNIKEVKLTSVSLSSDDTKTALDFSVNIVFNNKILNWNQKQ